MKMTESELLQTIKHFKFSKDEESKKKISEFLYILAKNYIFFVKKDMDEDLLQDIILILLKKTEKIIINFNENLSNFKTYIINILNNIYIDKKRNLKKKTKIIKYNKDETDGVLSSIENIPDKRLDDVKYSDKIKKLISRIFKKIKMKNKLKYLSLKLIFIDFFDQDDFILLKKYTKKSYKECLIFMDDILNNISLKNEIIKKYEDLLTNIFLNKVTLREKESEYKKIDDTQKNYLERYYSVNNNISYDVVSKFLGIPKYTIWNFIRSFKKEIKESLFT